MRSRLSLFWLRAGAVALIAALCVGDLVEHAAVRTAFWNSAVALVYILYAAIFLRNTAKFPRRLPWQVWLLVAQIALSVPMQSNLSVITCATIPLALPKDGWRKWLIVTVFLVGAQVAIRNAILVSNNRAQMPADVTLLSIVTALAAGTLEILAWHLFAFLAAVMIVRFDEDRRRLAFLNAEMKASKVLLMESGRLAERLRISRELHDSLGHHLTSLSLQLEVAEHLPDDELRPHLAQSKFLAKLLLSEIRQAVSDWRDEKSPALPEALRSLSDGIPGLTVRLDMQAELPGTAGVVTHALFRCAQEALTNSMRHGSASSVDLGLHYHDEMLTLRIDDDGAGCAAVAPGNGLAGMKARVDELGGTVAFATAPGKGFQVAIRVPVPEMGF